MFVSKLEFAQHKRQVNRIIEMLYKCIYCGNRVDPGEKFYHEHNGRKSDQIEYGVLLCMDCHTERHHGKKCNDIKEYCKKYLIKLYGESIYSK